MEKVQILPASHLWEQFLRWENFFNRPAVQGQLLTVAAGLLLAWLLSRSVRRWLKLQIFPQADWESKETKGSWGQYALALLHYLLMPALSLAWVYLLLLGFRRQGWASGLLDAAAGLLWAYLFYCCFLLVLYFSFPVAAVRRYRNRLFAPLFFLFACSTCLSLSTDLGKLSRVGLVELFGQPITLGDIFVVTAGSYFWIVGTSLLERLFLYLFAASFEKSTRGGQSVALLFRYLLIGLGIVLILGYVNFSPTALAAITGGLSVGLGFGLKEVFSNFISGIWLLLEGALKPGDVVSVDGEISEVKELGVRATTVQVVRDNSEKIIPNQSFFTQDVTTFTGSDRLVYRALTVGASYNCDPEQVLEVLLSVARQHPDVLKDPPPIAFFLGFGESSLDFELKFWLQDPLIGKRVTSQLGCAIWRSFKEKEIEIPYPQRDLHLRD